jgi:hypothetical protein
MEFWVKYVNTGCFPSSLLHFHTTLNLEAVDKFSQKSSVHNTPHSLGFFLGNSPRKLGIRKRPLVESMESQNHQEILKKRREKHVSNKRRGRSLDNFSEKTKRTRLRPITSENTACISSVQSTTTEKTAVQRKRECGVYQCRKFRPLKHKLNCFVHFASCKDKSRPNCLGPDKFLRVRPLGLFRTPYFPPTPLFDLSLRSKVSAVAKFSWNQKVAEYTAVSEFQVLKLMSGFSRHLGAVTRILVLVFVHFGVTKCDGSKRPD